MKTIFIMFSIFGLLLAFEDFPEECEELFEENIHPKKCCNFPSRKILDEHTENCRKVCKDSKSYPAGCCELDCIYDATGVLKKDQLVYEAVVKLYENYLEENGGGKYDKWMEIVENSVDECKKLVQKSSEVLVCSIPEYVLDFLDCIDSINFLNCPNYKFSKPCNKTRSIVADESKCGIKINGHFIINHRFWSQKDDDEEAKTSNKQ